MYPPYWPPYFPPTFNADTRFLYPPGFPPNGNPGPLPPHLPGCPCKNQATPQGDARTPTQPASAGADTGAGMDLRATYSSLLQALKKAEADSASNDAKVATPAKRKAQLIQVFFAGLFEGAGSIPAGSFEAALQPRKPSASGASSDADAVAAVLAGPADTRLGPLGFALFLAACAECVGHFQGMVDAFNEP